MSSWIWIAKDVPLEKTINKKSDEIENIKVIVFDLDDTIIDTFSLLITPLERKAAKKMVEAGFLNLKEKNLSDFLLDLRKKHPSSMEEKIAELNPGINTEILNARRAVFSKISLNNIKVNPAVISMLRKLRRYYKIYLLSEGNQKFQKDKIERLELKKIFDGIFIVRNAYEKEKTIASLIRKLNLKASNCLVVGNRMDSEIRAGNKLGTQTVWVKKGEGCLGVGEKTWEPDFTIEDILKLEKIIP